MSGEIEGHDREKPNDENVEEAAKNQRHEFLVASRKPVETH